MKKRIVVAMSGGVDSSTAAGILIEQGYEAIGLCMRLPNAGEVTQYDGCCGIRGIEDARGVAGNIGIPFYAINGEEEFDNNVISYFLDEYENGRTPNPCIICNEKIKFGSLLERAKSLGADYIATGHYARVEYDTSSKRYLLKKGRDKEKDQSYFLFSLSQRQLSHAVFPLGDYTKTEVRQLAREFNLKVHDKPASQEICFIPDNDYRSFLRKSIGNGGFRRGSIVNKDGDILGEHQGISFYTIGQRKGIGAYGVPLYVTSINKEKNIVEVGEERGLFKDVVIAEKVNWVDREKLTEPIKVKAKIRYRHPGIEATVFPLSGVKIKVIFDRPQRAITPGQALVLYDNDTLIGGGWIT